jgi:hypothetical protein
VLTKVRQPNPVRTIDPYLPKVHQFFRSCQRTIPGRRRFETFRSKLNFYGEELLAPLPTPSWGTTACRLSATAYAIYLQLPSVSGGLPSIRNLRTLHTVVSKDPPKMENLNTAT